MEIMFSYYDTNLITYNICLFLTVTTKMKSVNVDRNGCTKTAWRVNFSNVQVCSLILYLWRFWTLAEINYQQLQSKSNCQQKNLVNMAIVNNCNQYFWHVIKDARKTSWGNDEKDILCESINILQWWKKYSVSSLK